MRYEDLKYLEVPLPEAIAKEKWGGFFENARSRIAAYLDDETTDYALRCRLEMELGILQNLQERYTLCPEEAFDHAGKNSGYDRGRIGKTAHGR